MTNSVANSNTLPSHNICESDINVNNFIERSNANFTFREIYRTVPFAELTECKRVKITSYLTQTAIRHYHNEITRFECKESETIESNSKLPNLIAETVHFKVIFRIPGKDFPRTLKPI